ncbi:MAG TPA: prolipoprotein diacylglyceryl transferase [Pseudolysinimonas sp.]|nr:prolipoprotein diacylglyceryl transferase [Pseudolysinimonas sp.]
MIPLSIPSPPSEWSSFTIPLGAWLHGLFPGIAESYGVTVHVYALAILLGIIVALLITNVRLTRRGGEPWIIIDLTFWGLILGIIGARLWHVFTHVDDYFGPGKDLTKILYVWEGGLAIFGGLLAGSLGFFIGARIHGLRFLSVADAIAPTVLLAQALGRFGNYFNQELFGLPTDLPWGLKIDRPNAAIPTGLGDNVLFHPTFLYEMIWNVAGALLIIFVIENVVTLSKSGRMPRIELTRRPFWQWGKVLGLYLIWYGIGRSWFESIRLDPSETFLGIRSNVWGALAAIVLGIVIIAVQTRRHPGLEPSVYLPGRQWIDPSAVESSDTYSDTDDGDDAAAEDGSNKPTISATSGTSSTS